MRDLITVAQFTIKDMVNFQFQFLKEKFNISHLKGVIGTSMGGFQALQWAVSYPDSLDFLIPIVTSYKIAGLNYACSSRFFAKHCRHYAGFQIVRHANDYGINGSDPKAGDDLRVGHVGTLAHGQICGRVVYDSLIGIYGNDLHAVLYKLSCHGCAVSSKSKDCVCFLCFHCSSPYPILISSVGSEMTF